ncbi:MAG: uracil-DNA glycosylase [Desulfotomaculum sp.]|nr:uracil-DNA glycosylase [Desulfotomaculum sp.]
MSDDKIICQKCKYFYVTWDDKLPRGCKAYGFKTRHIPSLVVYRTTGHRCVCYKEKETKK